MASARNENLERTSDVKPISVLIVDDVDIVRLGMQICLDSLPGFTVVGQAADGETAIKLALQLRPDVVLMDVTLPNIDGIGATTQIKNVAPKTRIIIFTVHDQTDLILAALGAGAEGFCLKELSSEQLTSAICSVVVGERWIDPRLSKKIAELTGSWQKAERKDLELVELELKILSLLEEGMSSDDMAARLGVSKNSVTSVIDNMVDKLLKTERGSQKKSQGSEVVTSHSGGTLESSEKEVKASAIPAILRTEGAFDGRYQITSLIDIGGMGIVYKAMHLHMERLVAIKVLHPDSVSDPKLVGRLKTESRAISSIKHPNIVNVHDFGVTKSGQPYLVMDYVEGLSLHQLLEKTSSIDAHRCVDIFTQVCDGLTAIHKKGLIHCDLKPSNIMIQDDGGGSELVKILDFGLARFLPQGPTADLRLTDSFEVTGSPLYMSPEQCNGGPLDARSDIYSLGCIMYEAFTGKPVFDGATPYKVFSQHFSEKPKPFTIVQPILEIPSQLEGIVFKALEKYQDERYSTAVDLKQDLLRFKGASGRQSRTKMSPTGTDSLHVKSESAM